MDVITLRAFERILAVIIGGICIYLGYRLFLHMPEEKDGETKLKLPGGISIFITRVGPGVFFALFGAAVVALSLYYGIVYSKAESAESAETVASAGTQTFYRGIMSGLSEESEDDRQANRLKLALEIEFLNSLPGQSDGGLSEAKRRDLAVRVTTIKLALMKSLWGPEWGDYDYFVVWAEGGGVDPVPEELKPAAEYYHSGLKGIE